MIDDKAPIVALAHLRTVMSGRGYTASKLAQLTPLTLGVDRIADLMARDAKRTPEPWLDEAYTLARLLGLDDIATLIGMPIDQLDPLEDVRGDLNIWRTGCRLPLSHACRLALRFGLPDPYDLFEVIRLRDRSRLLTSLWTMSPAPGECSWCGGSGDDPLYHGHTPTCTMNNLWGPRDLSTDTLGGTIPYPRTAGKRQNGMGRKAPGLRALRKREKASQANMALNVGCSEAHWCKMENLTANLTPEIAAILIRKFPPLTMVELYTAPTKVPPVPREQAEQPSYDPGEIAVTSPTPAPPKAPTS